MYWCNLDKPIEILKEYSKDTIYAIEMSNAEKLKHSKNPRDLIEKGDYVNGHKVYEFVKETFFSYVILDGVGNYIDTLEEIPEEDIETIQTKEQFEANCYKVKEEIC